MWNYLKMADFTSKLHDMLQILINSTLWVKLCLFDWNLQFSGVLVVKYSFSTTENNDDCASYRVNKKCSSALMFWGETGARQAIFCMPSDCPRA